MNNIDTFELIKIIGYDFYKWVCNIHNENLNILKMRYLTFKDIKYLCLCKSGTDKILKDDSNPILSRAISSYGTIPSTKLYRGVSLKEVQSILNSNTTILSRSMSFSEYEGIAKRFIRKNNGSIVTVSDITKKLFNLEAFYIALYYVIMFIEKNIVNDNNRIKDLECSWFSFAINLEKNIKTIIDLKDKNSIKLKQFDDIEIFNFPKSINDIPYNIDIEYEWLIPKSTKFIPIDVSKLMFTI